jgi:ribonucleoside-diphosphate reductase alpha chain
MVQNLFSYVDNPFTETAKFNFTLFYEHAVVAQRLMDNVIDLEIEKIDKILEKIESDPESNILKQEELFIWNSIKNKCIKGRRTGLGITATGDTIAALGLKYGSEESVLLVEQIHKTQKHASYESSCLMAKELGTFPIWDWEKEKNSNFILQIKEENTDLYKLIHKYGRRNIANLTIAPTGSVSLLTRTTSGIEPLFMLEPYVRRKKINSNDSNVRIDFVDKNGDSWQEFKIYHPKVKMWMDITGNTDITKSPWYGCCAQDIDWKMRVKLQAHAQKHIDHAISSTINLPENVKEECVAEMYEAAWKMKCKGITVYRDNCRTGVLVSSNKNNCSDNNIEKTHAPKRPKDLKCDVYHTSVKGTEFFVLVGLWEDGSPYEVFAGKNGMIAKNVKSGILRKIKRGKYMAVFDDGSVMDDINLNIEDDYEAITRLCSTSLRHGCDIGFVVHQLEKVKGSMNSFSKAISRNLKKYIKDGTKIHGEECPNCSSISMERREGCVTCMSCGFSKCS